MAAYIKRAKTIHWLTPEHVWRWGLDVLDVDRYDFDLASHPQATVPAASRWTGQNSSGEWDPEHDGFLKKPAGPLGYSNPPFGERPPKDPDTDEVDPEYLKVFHPLSQWVKLQADLVEGRQQAVFQVLPASTSSAWFHDQVVERCAAFCLLRRRIRFDRPGPEGKPLSSTSPGQGHMTVLWSSPGTQEHSDRLEAFERVLDPHGLVVVPG